MFGVKWKLIFALCFLNLRVGANPSGSKKKKIGSEINSRHHLPTRNENSSSEKSEEMNNILKLTENVKNSPKNKIIRKSSKHELVRSINIKSQNGDKLQRRNKFRPRHMKYSRKDNTGESKCSRSYKERS